MSLYLELDQRFKIKINAHADAGACHPSNIGSSFLQLNVRAPFGYPDLSVAISSFIIHACRPLATY